MSLVPWCAGGGQTNTRVYFISKQEDVADFDKLKHKENEKAVVSQFSRETVNFRTDSRHER